MLDFGSNVNLKDKDNATAAHWLVYNRDIAEPLLPFLQILGKAGANFELLSGLERNVCDQYLFAHFNKLKASSDFSVL